MAKKQTTSQKLKSEVYSNHNWKSGFSRDYTPNREEDEEEKQKLERAYELYNATNNSFVGNTNDQRAAMDAALNGVMGNGPVYGNYTRMDQAQAAYLKYRNELDQIANDGMNSFQDQSRTLDQQRGRAMGRVEEYKKAVDDYNNSEWAQLQKGVDAATKTLDGLDEETQKKLNKATKLTNQGFIGTAQKIYDELKADNNWTDQQLHAYITDSATLYDNDWRGGAAYSNVEDFDKSTKESRVASYDDLTHKIKTGRTLTDNEQLTYAQAEIDKLPYEERQLIQRYWDAKQANRDGQQMGISTKREGETVNDVLKDIKNNTNWDKDTRQKYLDYADRLFNYQTDKANLDAWSISNEDNLTDKRWKEIGGSIAKVGSSPFASTADFVGRLGKNPEGFTADTHNPLSMVANTGEQIQAETSEDIGQHTSTKAGKWAEEHLGQNLGQLAYNSGMAAAESAVNAYLGKAAAGAVMADGLGMGAANAAQNIVGLTPFATSGYNSGYDSARERNLSGGAAIAEGLAGGVAEVLTEKVSLDNLWELADGTRAGRNIIVNALVQAGIEGTEELSSDALNAIADNIITTVTGDANQFEYYVSQAMQEGATREEAKTAAKNRIIQDAVVDGLSGFLSGGASGVGASAVGVHNANKVNKQAKQISNTYKNLAANTDDMTAKEKYEQIANNPYQKMADDVNVVSDDTNTAKNDIQDVADRVASGKKATISDRASVAESIRISEGTDNAIREYNDSRSVVPDEYKTKRTEITADEGYKKMNEAAGKGDSATMLQIKSEMANSTNANARMAAQDTFDSLRAKAEYNGATNLDSNITNQQDAYLAGLNEESFETDNSMLQQAYNDGKAKAIDVRSKTMIETKDALNNVKATDKSGTVFTVDHIDGDSIVTTDGKTMKASDLSIEDTGAGNFIRRAMDLKGNTAKQAFLDNAEDGAVLNVYSSDFQKAYKAGQAGLNLDNIKGITSLSDEAKKNIYDAGVKDQFSEVTRKAAQVLSEVVNRGTGEYTDNRKGVHFDDSYLIGRTVASVTGLNVVLMPKKNASINAQFDATNSTITVYSSKQMKQIFHEVGEFMQVYNAEGHESLRAGLNEVALNVLGGERYDRWHSLYMDGYAKAGDAQSNLDITNEMANDLFVALMETSKGRKAMAEYLAKNVDQSVAQELATKFSNMVSSIADAVKNMVSNSDTSFQKAVLKKGAAQLEGYADQFIKELDKAIQTYQGGEVKTVEEGTKKSIDPKMIGKLKDSNYIHNNKVTVSNMNSVVNIKDSDSIFATNARDGLIELFNKIGFVNNKEVGSIDITNESARSIINHKPTRTKLIASSVIDKILENGKVVYFDNEGARTNEYDTVVVSAPITVEDGKYPGEYLVGAKVVVVKSSNYFELTEVAEIKKDNAMPLQTGDYEQSSFPRDTGYPSILKILQDVISVKYSLDNTGKELSPGQQEYFKDSQMRDDNGALKRFYHGTGSYGFDIFDISKAKSTGLYGKGFYFGDSSTASTYGKTYEVYLNIVNPLKNGTKDITRDQLLKLVNAVANDEDMGIDNYGYGATPQSIVDSLMGKDDFAMLQDINATCVGDFAGLVKMFNNINGTAYDGIQAEDQTIAFYSNQIKDVNNLNPSNGDNIYHSIQVAEFDDLEEESKKTKGVSFGKTLIAVHNLGVEQLRGIFELDGLPSPSIAIIKAGMEHSKYGPISIMFKKDTIDPAVSKKNKVYSGDAWTPTFPRVEVKISEKAADAIWDKLNGLVTDSDQKALGYLNVDSSTMEDNANSARGSLVDAYSSKDIFKLAYLRDKGIDVPEVAAREERLNQRWKNDQIQYVANLVDAETVYEFRKQGYRSFEENKDLAEKFRQALNEHFKEYMKNQSKDRTNINKLLEKDFYEEFDFSDWDNLTAGIYKYYRDGIRNEVDPYAYKDAVRSAVTDEADYEAWLSDLFKDAVEKRGLRNNKDVFTYSGNRRSWEALHDEYTLDNVVKIMNQDDSKGADAIFTQSVIKALATKEFKSIADIHKSENQIQMVSDEEYDAINKEWQDRVNDIVEDIYSRSNSNIFMAHDSAMEAIADAIKRSSTVSGMQRVYDEYKSFLNIKEDTAQKTYDLLQYLKEIPTGYFEAKPRRAVWLEEIGKVILPSNTDVDIVNQLEDNGIAYEMYEAGNEAERTAILADSSDLRFSLNIEDDFFFNNENLEAVEEAIASTRGATEVLAKGIEALKNTEVSQTVVQSLANKIKKQTGSTINTKTLVDNLTKVFAYMQSEDFVDYADMMGILKEVARPVIDQATTKVGEEVYKEFVDSIKGYSIKLTDTQKKEVINTFGSYGRFRSMMMPLNINENGTSTLEQVWQEMSKASGYMLDYDVTEGEMPIQLYDVLTSMRPTLENAYGADAEEMAQDLAMQIVEEYFTEAGKEATKAEAKESIKKASDKMREYNKQYRADLKKRYDEQIKQLKKEANYNVKWRDAEHDALIKEIKARNKKRAAEVKERRLRTEYREKLKKDAGQLYNKVTEPTIKKHVPTDMVRSVLDFMTALDFVEPSITQNADGNWSTRVYDYNDGNDSKFIDITEPTREQALQKFYDLIYGGAGSRSQRTWDKRMSELNRLYKEVSSNPDYASKNDIYSFLSKELGEQLDELITNGKANVNDLSSSELKVIRNVIANINKAITSRDKALSGNENIKTLAQSTIDQATNTKDKKELVAPLQNIKELLTIDNLDPRVFMSYFGKAGKTLYKYLREGLNTEISDIKRASDFLDAEKERLGVDTKDITEWFDKKSIKEFTLGDGVIRLTPVQIMSLYETTKRAGAMDRIVEGIKPSDITNGFASLKQKPYHVNQADIKMITDTLTDTQKAFADAMQKYMATDCSEQGNEVSERLYGFRMYEDPTYFPYTVYNKSLPTTDKTVNNVTVTGEHAGFTNPLKKGATNVLVIDDIFNVFSRHVAEMSRYHGYTAANKDVLRWLNYKEFDDENGLTRHTVKESIEKITGSEKGDTYISNLLGDLAGVGSNGTKAAEFIDRLAGNFKAAAVMGNKRVVVQQPTAYFRALFKISPKYLFNPNVMKALKDVNRVTEISPIAWHKSKGFFETNIGPSLKAEITGVKTIKEKMVEATGYLAGKADDITWSLLWQAVENEQRDTHKGASDEEIIKHSKERFDELIDSTQVVDATLLKSQFMRDKNAYRKAESAFMAEPTKSYNMVAGAIIEDMQNGDKSFRQTRKAVAAYTIAGIATSAIAAVWDAVRKDDDDEKWDDIWWENFLANLSDNLNPLYNIPWIKDIWGEVDKNFINKDSYSTNLSRYDLDAILGFIDSVSDVGKIFTGNSTKTAYGNIMTVLKPVSQLFGVPAYSLLRDYVSIYNMFANNAGKGFRTNQRTTTDFKKGYTTSVDRDDTVEEITEQVTEGIENGTSIKDLREANKNFFKQMYFEAVDGSELGVEDPEAQRIAELAAKGLVATLMTDEEADEEINSWLEEKKTYGNLDKAIKAGDTETIASEVSELLDAKEPENINEHIIKYFGDTVKYEQAYNTDSNWFDTVDYALKQVDPEGGYNETDKWYTEKLEKKAADAEAAAVKAEKKQAVVDAVDSNDSVAFTKAMDDYVGQYKDASTGKTQVKKVIKDQYKDQYIEAYKNKDLTTANSLETLMARNLATVDKKYGNATAEKKPYNGDYLAYERDQIKKLLTTDDEEE